LVFVEVSPNDAGHADVPAAVKARSSIKGSSSESEQVTTLDHKNIANTRKAVYIVAVVPDITERRSQLECFNDEHKFQGLVVAAPNVVLTLLKE